MGSCPEWRLYHNWLMSLPHKQGYVGSNPSRRTTYAYTQNPNHHNSFYLIVRNTVQFNGEAIFSAVLIGRRCFFIPVYPN